MFKFLFVDHGPHLWSRRRGTIQGVVSSRFKSLNLWWFGAALVLEWRACTPLLWNGIYSMTQRIQDGWAALISEKNGKTFLSQNSSDWSLQFPDVHDLLLKEEEMLHSSKQLSEACWHQIQNDLLVSYGRTFPYFGHLMCFLCSVIHSWDLQMIAFQLICWILYSIPVFQDVGWYKFCSHRL